MVRGILAAAGLVSTTWASDKPIDLDDVVAHLAALPRRPTVKGQ